jgi:hypothetical protein
MAIYFDRAGNMFQIDDEKMLQRKKSVTVFNDRGEEFELSTERADEHRLTPDEQQKLMVDLRAKALALSQALGICPVIDPCFPFGAHLPPCSTFLRPCLVMDPVWHGALQGTPYMARAMQQADQPLQVSSLVSQLLQAVLAGCPNIDPTNLGTVIGTFASRYRLGQLGGGCTMMDPPDIRSLIGTINVLEQLQAARTKGVPSTR